MNKLDELLSIPNEEQRRAALIQYAKFLDVNPYEAVNHDGKLVEEKLVVMIHDGQLSQKKGQKSDRYLMYIAGTVFVVMFVIIIMTPRMMKYFYYDGEDPNKERAFKGLDQNGNVITEGGDKKPVLFKLMDGIYEEYYPSGAVKTESTYKDGNLLQKKTFDENGKLTGVEHFEPAE